MTTIAWDGVTLAADQQGNFDDSPVRREKLTRTEFHGEPAWVGCAGDIEQSAKVLEWICLGASVEALPVFPEGEAKDFAVLIVTKSKKVFYTDNSFFFHEMGKTPWAIGTGGKYAVGAMAHGASAKDAVEIACTLDINSGLGITVVHPGRL